MMKVLVVCDFKDILLDGLILEDIRNENYPNLKKWLRYQLFQKKRCG